MAQMLYKSQKRDVQVSAPKWSAVLKSKQIVVYHNFFEKISPCPDMYTSYAVRTQPIFLLVNTTQNYCHTIFTMFLPKNVGCNAKSG